MNKIIRSVLLIVYLAVLVYSKQSHEMTADEIAEVRELFNKADLNQNGVVTFDEVREYLKDDKYVDQ